MFASPGPLGDTTVSYEQFANTLENATNISTEWVWERSYLLFILLACGLIFSIASKFVQWRILSHGYGCIRGHYDKPGDTGHINHFQALCAALSATIGLGNIAGVAVAVSIGGPGAIFWMWIVGLFGMALKFMECSLAVMFRDVRQVPDSAGESRREVRGGPMWYMQKALVEPFRRGGSPVWVLFKILAVLFATATILNSFGAGNMFQGWNVADVLEKNFHVKTYISGMAMSLLVALVIIGGITRIGQVASRLVPFMCVVYVAAALYVIALHLDEVPYYLGLIVRSAFEPTEAGGAFAGVSVWAAFTWGLKRACFSNEAGEGSAAMAHAAARTEEPIREGIVAGIGPFVDTLVICTMSALVLLMTGAWNRPAVGTVAAVDGATVRIACSPDLPERIGDLYIERMRDPERTGSQLSIHLQRGADRDFQSVAAEIPRDALATETGRIPRWSDLETLTLDLAETAEEDRAAIAVGQQVHLDMEGAELTRFAFDTTLAGMGAYIITAGVCLFGFSTMISWSYYGEKGAEYLLGPGAVLPYKFVFVIFVFLGMVLEKFQWVYNFSDTTVGLMVFLNLPVILILSPHVLRAARDYFRRLDAGEFRRRGE